MNTLDKQVLRSVKQLARNECANYFNGSCLLEDRPCHVINSAYQSIHDGAVDCDYFLSAVLPLQPEPNTAVWHEIFREEGQAGEGWKECTCCHKPFVPGSNRQRYCANCGAAGNRPGIGKNSAAIAQGKSNTATLPFKAEKALENQRFSDTKSEQDDLLVILLSSITNRRNNMKYVCKANKPTEKCQNGCSHCILVVSLHLIFICFEEKIYYDEDEPDHVRCG